MIVRRPEEAMKQIEKAMGIDPFNIMVQSFYAIDLYCLRRYDEAVAQARKSLSMQPAAPVAQTALYNSLFMLRKYEEALAIDKAAAAADPESLAALERGFKEAGYSGAQRRWADLMVTRYEKKLSSAEWPANGYVYAGEKDLSLKWLEINVEAHDPNMPYLNCFHEYDFLRSDSRFQELLRRMGLPGNEKKQ
jgi:tetratricopeptide (TPR) repeat protein